MIRKIIILLLSLLFVGTFVVSSAVGNSNPKANDLGKHNSCLINPPNDQLDQEQPIRCGTNNLGWELSIGQSFKPQLSYLSKVHLYMRKEGNPGNPTLAIRESLTGSNLVTFIYSSDDFPTYWTWVEFDFDDIAVSKNQSYFIIFSRAQSDYLGNCYQIGWCGYEDHDLYTNGVGWELDEYYGWRSVEETWGYDLDFTFRTFGYSDEIADIKINVTSAGFGVSANIKNYGTASAKQVDWSIDIEPSIGLILSGSHTANIIDEIPAGGSKTIQSSGLRGIGWINITVQVADVVKQATGFLLGPLVLRVTEI